MQNLFFIRYKLGKTALDCARARACILSRAHAHCVVHLMIQSVYFHARGLGEELPPVQLRLVQFDPRQLKFILTEVHSHVASGSTRVT